MKVDHHVFEAMLHRKNISKKAFAKYARIPYFTVAGWKKSGKVPAYAMVLLENMPSPKTVTAKQLIDAGLPRAVLWNNDLTKAVPSDIFIVSTLQKAYNDEIIAVLMNFFGVRSMLAALMKHRERLSNRLIQKVMAHL